MKYYLEKLRQNHLKRTPKREAILQALSKKGGLLTPQAIAVKLKETFKKVSTPSIYKNLEQMKDIGIVHKITKPDRRSYYCLCTLKKDSHHHHIVCVKCGKVGLLNKCALSGVKEIDGFKVLDHHLQIDGLCLKCK